ncbi:hypothetical protein ANN_23937 [Periplaneta americana]|uniref:Calmodulin-lysine N-methyltransferase n=1 Tax=Periplaneta americana TaxID=6978 RepID=A0ABQ8S211_PERAM|nr:hypothetical protein ANN_23937 [Periplaneta americana]
MSPGSSTKSYPAFARIGLRENPGKNLNQVTFPNWDSNLSHLVSRPDTLTVTPQCINALRNITFCSEHSFSTTLDLVGRQIWRGALLLGDFVLHYGSSLLRDCTVLELGSGVGLTSIVAAMFAKEVICTVRSRLRPTEVGGARENERRSKEGCGRSGLEGTGVRGGARWRHRRDEG